MKSTSFGTLHFIFNSDFSNINYFSSSNAIHTNRAGDPSDYEHFHMYAIRSINPGQHQKSISFRYSE